MSVTVVLVPRLWCSHEYDFDVQVVREVSGDIPGERNRGTFHVFDSTEVLSSRFRIRGLDTCEVRRDWW